MTGETWQYSSGVARRGALSPQPPPLPREKAEVRGFWTEDNLNAGAEMLRRHAPLRARQCQRCHATNNTYKNTVLQNYSMIDTQIYQRAVRDTYRYRLTHYGVQEKWNILLQNHPNITIRLSQYFKHNVTEMQWLETRSGNKVLNILLW